MSFCPKCGKELMNNTSVCAFCGTNATQQPSDNQNYQQETVYVAQETMGNQYQSAPKQQYQSAPNQQPYQPQYQATSYAPPRITEDMLPSEYKPVSVWAYIGYSLLFSLPVIGFIMLFIVGFGSNYSKSLRNFARYNLLMMAISIVLVVLFYVFFFVIFGMSASGMMDEFMYYY